MEKVYKQVLILTQKIFKNCNGSHDFEHTKRVHDLCIKIGIKEKADIEILKFSALLHDIGRMQEDNLKGKVCHAIEGARMAKTILNRYKFDRKKINEIVHCIESHRYRGTVKPRTKEAKILFDADKLDSIGAIGIGRAFLFAGEIGAKLHNPDIDINKTKPYTPEDTAYREYIVKLKHIKKCMMTKEGKRIANDRDKFMKKFFKRLNDEVAGIK